MYESNHMTQIAFAELRVYEVAPGRMGDMLERYRGPLRELFARHGVEVTGAWHAESGPRSPLFVYLMHWSSLEARARAWNGFYADPQWARVRAETNGASELVERYDLHFLSPITALRPESSRPVQELELQMCQVRIGASGAARQWLQAQAPQALQDSGGQLLGAYECMTGEDLPRVCVFVGWRDAQARLQAPSVLAVDPLGRADRYALRRA